MADLRVFQAQVLPPLKWQASPNRSDRDSRPRMVVVHTAEGGYEGTVSWLCNPRSDASSHLVLNDDGSEATQLVRYSEKAWTQRAFNDVALSIEVSGRLADRWKHPIRARRQLRRLARVVAFLLQEYKLPVHWVQNHERHSAKGFTRHGDLAPEGGHPLCLLYTGWRWRRFRRFVKREYDRGHFRKEWGRE